MPTIHATAPPEAEALLVAHLPVVLSGPSAHRHGAKNIELTDVQVSEPHVGYHFRLDDLLTKKRLGENATPSAYSYFVFDNVDPIGIAQIAIRGRQLQWAGLTSGPTVGAKIRKLQHAEKEVEKYDESGTALFEFRGLHIPAVRFAGVWLHAEKDGEVREMIIPLHDHPSGLKQEKVYPWAKVRDALQDSAKEAQVVHDASVRIP